MYIKSLKDYNKTPQAMEPRTVTALTACLAGASFDGPEIRRIPMVRIVKSNAGARGLSITYGAALLIALTCHGNPGMAISMLHAMNLSRVQRECEDVVTMIGHEDFVSAFPQGTPSFDDFGRWWDEHGKSVSYSQDPEQWPMQSSAVA